MKSVIKITAEEARKMHYESQKFKREEFKKRKRVTPFNGILVGIITWGTLLMFNTIAYANGSQQDALNFLTKGYRIKPKITISKPIQQFPKDIVNLATAWREIPKTTYYAGQEDGAIMGIVVGPIKGTALMAKNISKGVWYSLNSNQDQSESEGLVFSYKF